MPTTQNPGPQSAFVRPLFRVLLDFLQQLASPVKHTGASSASMWPLLPTDRPPTERWPPTSVHPPVLPVPLAVPSDPYSHIVSAIGRLLKVCPSTLHSDCSDNDYGFVRHRREGRRQHRESTCSPTTSCLKYLISIDRANTTPFTNIQCGKYGTGTYWYMYAIDGDKPSLHLRAVSISKSSAHLELLSGSVCVSGQPFLSSWITITIPAFHLVMKTMSSLHSSISIVSVVSGLR